MTDEQEGKKKLRPGRKVRGNPPRINPSIGKPPKKPDSANTIGAGGGGATTSDDKAKKGGGG